MKCSYLFSFVMVGVILLLSLCSATDTLGVFEINKDINLLQVCDNCSYVNLTTVQLPNSTILSLNTNMTSTGTTFNASFSQTDLLGNYIYTTCGDVDGILTCESVSFIVTTTGSILSTAQGIVYIVFLIAVLFIFSLSLYGAIKIPWKHTTNTEGKIIGINDLKYMKIILWTFTYMVALFGLGITNAIMNNFLFWTGASIVFNWLYWILFSFLFPVMVFSIVMVIITILTNLKFKSAFERNVPLR